MKVMEGADNDKQQVMNKRKTISTELLVPVTKGLIPDQRCLPLPHQK